MLSVSPLLKVAAGRMLVPCRWSNRAWADRSALKGMGLGAVVGTRMERASPYWAVHWMQLKGASS
jgi:hypothetical protein